MRKKGEPFIKPFINCVDCPTPNSCHRILCKFLGDLSGLPRQNELPRSMQNAFANIEADRLDAGDKKYPTLTT